MNTQNKEYPPEKASSLCHGEVGPAGIAFAIAVAIGAEKENVREKRVVSYRVVN